MIEGFMFWDHKACMLQALWLVGFEIWGMGAVQASDGTRLRFRVPFWRQESEGFRAFNFTLWSQGHSLTLNRRTKTLKP